MKKQSHSICLFILCLIILSSIFLTHYFNFPSLKLESDFNTYLNDQWLLSNQNQEITLPVKLNIPRDVPYTITRVLDENFSLGQVIGIRGSLQNIEVSLDNETIYHVTYTHSGPFVHPMVSAWHIIDLPPDANGKELTITFQTPIKDMSGVINEIFYGSKSDVLYYIQQKYGWGFFGSVMIFIFGLLMVALPLIFKPLRRWHFINLGLFTLFISLWLMAESRMLQFFIGSPLVLGSLAYIALTCIPIPILIYIKNTVIKGYQAAYNVLIVTFGINLVFISFLQFSGHIDFYESVRMTHFLIVMGLILLLSTLIIEMIKYHNQEAKHVLISMGVLAFFAMIELFDFYFNDKTFTSFYVRIGLILFILIQVVESTFRLIHYLKKSLETEYFEKLAYEDRVTGGFNRMAFEKDLEAIFSTPNLQNNLRLMLFDLNGLKKINDAFGHMTGDHAIKTVYTLLHESFEDLGHCYRIGGDEYACVFTDIDFETIEKQTKLLNEKIKGINKTLPYEFGLAIGAIEYDPTIDETWQMMMHRADQKMYEDKRKTSYLRQ